MSLNPFDNPSTAFGNDVVYEGDWVSVAKSMRKNRLEIDAYLLSKKALEEPVNAGVLHFSSFMANLSPIVQYLIPKQVREHLFKNDFEFDCPLIDIIAIPFNPMAIAYAEEPSRFTLLGIDKNILFSVSGGRASRIDLNKTIKELKQEGHGNLLDKTLSVLLFISSGDHSNKTVTHPGSSKKYRNNKIAPTVIRGEVGGKFMSALRRYEAQRDAEAASRPHGSPRPHIRAGHFALYWTGKGSRTGTGPKIPKVQFIHPCLVNADSVGPDVEIQRTVKS